MDTRARFDDAATASLHLFADHLDAALAYCEDIAGARCERTEAPAGAGLRALTRRARAFETFAGGIREREIAVLLRLQQARVRARELIGCEGRLDPVLKLFLGGTAGLADAADLMTAEAERHAEAGGSLAAYLRSRGVATSSLAAADDLTPGEVEILHPQVKRLQEPKAGAVEQRRDCRRLTVQCSKQGGNFLLSQHRRQPLRLTCSDDIVEPLER